MDGFKKMILISAIIILIILLVLIGVALNYAKDESWPPMTPSCPDYFITDGSGNDARCVDIKDLTNTTCRQNKDMNDKYLKVNFNTPAYTGSNGTCNKYRWATNCGVAWDGITYGVVNPCEEVEPKEKK
jgi:hypothetical protein